MPEDQNLSDPIPNGHERTRNSQLRRMSASEVALRRPSPSDIGRSPPTQSNGEETKFTQTHATNFTKGLPRDTYGFAVGGAYRVFANAIDRESDTQSGESYFDREVPLGPVDAPKSNNVGGFIGSEREFTSELHHDGKQAVEASVRRWESPRAGHVYDLQGPDADSVCMPPAPKLGSEELAVEMAELYASALLRDVPFSEIADGSGAGHNLTAKNASAWIAEMNWFDADYVSSGRAEEARRQARGISQGKAAIKTNAFNLFRGSSPGCKVGPYVSQFLLRGNTGRRGPKVGKKTTSTLPGRNTCFEPDDGYIVYGAQIVDQRVAVHLEKVDYMTDWSAWIDVQNGIDTSQDADGNAIRIDRFADETRFITTPRDLATYVHYDQLYQAYLNAALMLLSGGIAEGGTKFARGFPTGGASDKTRGSFATFGGPHLLALLTEVSSRALRAVRRQKFNYHRRARPEAIGQLLSIAASSDASLADFRKTWDAGPGANDLLSRIPEPLMQAVRDRNDELGMASAKNQRWVKVSTPNPNWLTHNHLLPMAFPEGSPMHPAYGAGHATVAGACVTVLKAFFEMFDEDGNEIALSEAYEVDPASNGARLKQATLTAPLTLQGELNKLAANISIGRNMAGVHFYTDYYESLRMGERIAVGIIQEQMLNYSERVVMEFDDFDGRRIRIEGSGDPVELPNVFVGPEQKEADALWWLCEAEDPRYATSFS